MSSLLYVFVETYGLISCVEEDEAPEEDELLLDFLGFQGVGAAALLLLLLPVSSKGESGTAPEEDCGDTGEAEDTEEVMAATAATAAGIKLCSSS